ncbi:MAG: DEAD/DEAH box helicase [Intestinibacter sp.]|uniref:DEAD/DEAH box helicase n=3 Tax=Intestinibacter sp. TaxID=1965304 RepID=UPI002A82A057|nr:DEAD/DEAH box helicase [Intestinibacter sp.]MDY4575748.1 DEAD/DEAH box helicase [Intestinibacter sp.]
MEISKIGEILRINTQRVKYNSGFVFYKNNYVSNNYASLKDSTATFYGSVYDEHHRKTYTAMISINLNTRVISNASCDCQNAFTPNLENKICPHMVAIVLKGLEHLKNKNKKTLSKKDVVINPVVKFNISQSRNSNLGADLDIEGIDKSEYYKIFKSYKENYKYHLMPDGSYLDLRDNDLEKIFKLIDVLDLYADLEKIKIPNNKSIFLDSMLEDLNFVSGKKYVDNVIKKYDKLNKNMEIPNNLNATLRDYQVEGFEFLKTLANYGFGGILADEMGLGKTVQTLVFLLSEQNKKSMVVTPTALIYNWKSEFERFTPNIKVALVYGDREKRKKILENREDYDVILTTYGTYKNDIKQYENLEFDYLVIDEAQNIKNPNSDTTKSIKKIKAKSKFALTGTPIENNLLELWSIFDFVMPGYLYTKDKFEKIFVNDDKNIEALKNMIKPFILRRRKKDVIDELPDKIEQKFYVELDKEHKKVYKAFVSLLKRQIVENGADNMTLFANLTKLRMLSISPEVVVKNYRGKNSKLEMLVKIIQSSKNRKILVFSQFTKILGVISDRLKKENISFSYLDGKTDAKRRLELVEDFNEDESKKVFLISLKAGGTGLNLTSASMVIHFDPWFNPAVEDQASDRAHRIGQKNIVDVIKLISKGTVEEKVVAIKEYKKELADDVINTNLENNESIKKLSREEIIDLFENMD